MTDLIKNIITKQISFEGAQNIEKFYDIFTSIYNIELFKDGLDLVLTRMQEGNLKFEIKIIKGWDTNVGCYLTEQNKVFNKFLGKFSEKLRHKIIIKSLLVNVVAHEMAHALEVEGGITLNEDFRKAIGFDMKNRSPNNIALKGEIQRVMVEGVKSYPNHQIISELFARYFELLSISRNVKKTGDFLTKDVMDFFANSTKWIDQVFNPRIKNKVDLQIANYTSKLIQRNAFDKKEKFAHKVDSFYKRVDASGKKTWSANIRSNAAYQQGWEKHQGAIASNNNKNIEDNSNK